MKPPFDTVVEEHGATVLRVARALLPGRPSADADDAWSETFLAALRAWPDLPATANVEAWLVTIVRRKVIDLGRARTRQALPVAEPPDATAPPAPLERDLDLAAAVGSLPGKQRRAVVLHHLAGLPHAEVAALLGGTEAAARRAAADGVRALRTTHSLLLEDPT